MKQRITYLDTHICKKAKDFYGKPHRIKETKTKNIWRCTFCQAEFQIIQLKPKK